MTSEAPDVTTRRLGGDRFVSGLIRYLDDGRVHDCLHIAFARSPHAHARIISIEVSAARKAAGVHAVLTGTDTATLIGDLICAMPPMLTGTETNLTIPCLPTEYVRYVGEPIAVVVADSAAGARAAIEQIDVDFDVMIPMLDIAAATGPTARPQHPDLQTNMVMSATVVEGDAAAAIEGAARTVSGRVLIGRSSAVALEPRGCIASWEADTARLIVRAAIQTPHLLRSDLARQLRMAESDIQVVAPPLGGAFGFKFIGLVEEPLTCMMAVCLRRTVRWVETRDETLLVGAREYAANYTMGLDSKARVTGLDVELDANIGALAATPGPLMPFVAANTFPGPYDIANFEVRWRAVMTNKGPWNGARGFGKEATCLILESAMDEAARVFGLDPVEVRLRNLLCVDQFPHQTPTMNIDSGDYQSAMEQVLTLSDYTAVRARGRRRADREDRRYGVGVGFELTPEGMDSGGTMLRGFETSTVRLDTSGQVVILTGVTSPGTGSDTAIAQLVASQLGVSTADIRVVQGDTDRTPYGSGSFSSRAVLAGGTAAWLAAGDLRETLIGASATLLGAAPDQIEVADGFYRVVGDPSRAIAVSDLPALLRSLGGAVPGVGAPQLESTRTYGPGNLKSIPDENGRLQLYPTYSYSVHVAEVEVDVETGTTRLLNLSGVHDCGTMINPGLVEAQLHGAMAMGVGLALLEEERYDTMGHPINVDFKRYILPRVKDLPIFRTGHLCSPSPFTELGVKGAGESGVGGAAAAIVGAIRNALGNEHESSDNPVVQLPMTPPRTLALLDAMDVGV